MARYYTHDGKKKPSVTTICGQMDKPGLMYWAANSACDYIINNLSAEDSCPYTTKEILPIIEKARKNFRKVSARALDIGSAVHAAIEHYLKTGQEPQAPLDEVLSAFMAFLEWLDQWDKWETIKTEHTLYADRYAGTCDWIVMLNGVKYLIDFKTYNENSKTKPPYEEVRYQTAAYRAIDPTIEANGVLYLGKSTGMPQWFNLSENYEKDLKTFNILTDLYYQRFNF